MRATMAIATSVLAVSLAAGHAEAMPISYIETVTGSGTLGGVAFSDALITFTETADTTDVMSDPFEHLVQDKVATVQVDGLGVGTFSQVTSFLIRSTNDIFDFYQGPAPGGGYAILTQQFTALQNYDLSTPIGPVTGSGDVQFNSSITFNTSAGGFLLTSVSSNVTFAAVPEPASLTLVGLGLAGVIILTRSRPRRRA